MQGDMRNAFKVVVRKLVGNRPQRGPRHRWDNNVRMDLREIRW
jgi:hypothetical protein